MSYIGLCVRFLCARGLSYSVTHTQVTFGKHTQNPALCRVFSNFAYFLSLRLLGASAAKHVYMCIYLFGLNIYFRFKNFPSYL